MKPLFLDCPGRYTRASRNEFDPISYACGISHQKARGYGFLWWAAMALIGLATLVVVVL